MSGAPTLRDRVRSGAPLLGCFVTWPTAGVLELAAIAGFDFAVLDMEHGVYTVESVAAMCVAADAAGVAAIVRVPSCAATAEIGRSLDAGAAGLLFPRGDGAPSIRDAIAAARYPPEGRRGLGAVRANRYGAAPYAAHVRDANAAVLLTAQIETAEALEQLPEIAGIDGLDVLFVGPNDLTQALGIPGAFSDPRYGAALARVVAAARGTGRAAGIMATRREQLPELAAAGFSFVTVSDRTLLLESGRAWRALFPARP